MVANNPMDRNNKPIAPYITFLVLAKAQVITGKYHEFNLRINRDESEFGFSIVGFKNKEETTGTKVKHKIMAPTKAKLKVMAIGLNILPSIPDKDKIGMKTIKIISCPKMAEFIILEALL
jgi:hypothetical protein